MPARDALPSRTLLPRPPRERLRDALTGLRRAVLRRRRLLAAALAGLAVLATLRAVAPPPPPTATMLVAVRDLPAGAVLRPDDLVATRVAPDVVPAGAQSAEQAEGRMLAAPLRAGEPLTDVRLVGRELAEAQPAGTVVLPVRLSDAGQAALLRVGDRIDLLATDPQSGEVATVAAGARVTALPDPQVAADGALPGRLVVVTLGSERTAAVTAASVSAFVTFTWRHR